MQLSSPTMAQLTIACENQEAPSHNQMLRRELLEVLDTQRLEMRDWIQQRLTAHVTCMEKLIARQHDHFTSVVEGAFSTPVVKITDVALSPERPPQDSPTPCGGDSRFTSDDNLGIPSTRRSKSGGLARQTPRSNFVPLAKPHCHPEVAELGMDLTTPRGKQWLTRAKVRASFDDLKNLERRSHPMRVFARNCKNSKFMLAALERISQRRLHFGRLQWFVGTEVFRGVIHAMIVLNLFFVAIQTDHGVRSAMIRYDEKGENTVMEPLWMKVTDYSFSGAFFIELLMRMLAEEGNFWVGKHNLWNLFDLVVVTSSILEYIFNSIHINVTYIRILRLLKTFRALRIVRLLRTFRALRVMLISIMNSLYPLMWALVFLAMTIFLFSILFLSGVTSFFDGLVQDADYSLESRHLDAIRLHFSSFPAMAMALFEAISAGLDWWELQVAFTCISDAWGIVFVFYIATMLVGIMNIITGLFVESAMHISRMDRDLGAQEEIERSIGLMSDLKALFREIDTDGYDTISYEQFEQHLRLPTVQAYFVRLGLDITDAHELFRVLDADHDQTVEIDEFVMGCIRLMGSARTVNVVTLIFEQRVLITKLADGIRFLDERMKSVTADIHRLLCDAQVATEGAGAARGKFDEHVALSPGKLSV
mmetsp:Transcript_73673/g.204879  ORF Transcript_73673/g.204879 Transcript_73673/m.204879 type:complete len:649 (+) Transcript_73673:54-2000(+)